MKTLLYQDDAAPDANTAFHRQFEELMHTTVKKFKEAAKYTSVDDGYSRYWELGVYMLEIHADDPYYHLRIEDEFVIRR